MTKADADSSAPAPKKPTEGFTLDVTPKYDGNVHTLDVPTIKGVTYTPAHGSESVFKNDGSGKRLEATNAGTYSVDVAPDGVLWNDGTSTPVTYTLTIDKAEIGEDWSDFSKTQEHIYHADGNKYRLALPDVTDPTFPLSPVDKPKPTPLSAGDITVKYIIETHNESDHLTFSSNFKLSDYEDAKYDSYWKPYSSGGKAKNGNGDDVDFDTDKPLGYCVIFKAEDPNGNHKPLYGYFSVHIFTEKLLITLTSNFSTPPKVEYGEVVHTQAKLRQEVLAKISKIEAQSLDGTLQDQTTNYKNQLDAEATAGKFKFYFRDDDTVGQGTRYDVPDVDDNTRLDAGKTYYLFLEYVGDGEDGSEKYITFEWKLPDGTVKRPSFEVTPRQINVTLNVTGTHKYDTTPPTNWVTASASRSDGKDWYGTPNDSNISTLKIQYNLKKSDNTGLDYSALSSAMPAGAYNVTATSGNTNYEFTATGTYTVDKGDYSITFNDFNDFYCGSAITNEISSLPAGVTATYSYKGKGATTYPASAQAPTNAGTYEVTATFTITDTDNYNVPADITADLTIDKAIISFTLNSATGAYTGAEHTNIDVTFDTLALGDNLQKDTDYKLIFSVGTGTLGGNNLPQEKGTYNVTVNLLNTVAANNYEIAPGTQETYTIGIGTLAEPTGNDVSGVYNGNVHTLTISGYDGTKMSYSITGSGAAFDGVSAFTATNAGTYTLNVTITNTGDYQWSGSGKTQFTITISKAPLTVTAVDQSVVYGTTPAYSVTYSGFVSGESETSLNYTATASSTYTFANGIGNNFPITVNLPSVTLDNYAVTPVPGKLTVTRKPITLKISDGGHGYSSAPASITFGLDTPLAGTLVGSDTVAQICALVTSFRLEQSGITVPHANPATLGVGAYDICADDGDYGNYTVTFTNGTYTVSQAVIATPTADLNEQNFVYTGAQQTYNPVGFDSDTMTISGNTRTAAGTQKVRVTLIGDNLIFDNGANFVEFDFTIKKAEIIVRKGSNEWFDESFEQGTGSGDFTISFLEKDGDDYKYIVTVDGCEVEVKFDPVLKAENAGAGAYTSSVPPTIPRASTAAGRYVIYYEISDPAENHETLHGEWRVEIADRAQVLAVIFNKQFKAPYGMTYDPEQIFRDKSEFDDGVSYISVYKFVDGDWEEQELSWFAGIADVKISKKHNNYYGNQNTGAYDISFELKSGHEGEWTIMYKFTNDDYDSNEDMFVIEKAKLGVIWSNLTFEWNADGNYPVTATLAVNNYSEPLEIQLEITKDGRPVSEISESGNYLVTARLEDDYGNFELMNATQIIEVKAAPTADDGMPVWVIALIAAGAGLAVIIAVVAIVIVMKKKKSKEAAATAVQTASPPQNTEEPKVVYRDINSDNDGFYDKSSDGNGDDEEE